MKLQSESYGSVNVLWDGGATVSLITFRKAKELRLEGRICKLSITSVGGKTQNIDSYAYKLRLRDTKGHMKPFTVYGIKQISSDIRPIEIAGVVQLFPHIKEEEIARPVGNIDVLIGYKYAVNHPTMIEASGNLVLLGNKFGKCLGGCHPLLKERTKKSIHLVNHLSSGTTIRDFLDLESLGVNSIPLCGNCRCGKCPIGSNNYSIKVRGN